MPIRIVEYKPTGQGRDESLLIGSEALRLLEGELQKYCSGRSDGGSFLIAGHRGAGKTTLVRGAIQRVEKILLEQRAQGLGNRDSRVTLRPLLVPLQGPNLLPPDDKDRETTAAESADAKPSAESGKTPQPTAMETVLIQITLGLYRALANRFSEAYTASVFRRGPGPNPARELELAAQFELDLDEYPGKARLREYWRRMDALESGILFSDGNRPPGNGFRELVALSSACEAYQRIAGHFSRESKNTSGSTRESQSEFAVEAKGGEFLKPFTALLAGGAVGAGVAAIHANPATAVCLGLVTALASTAVFRYSAKRSRQQAVNRSELFIPDLSVATLDRLLPVLIQRIVRAGLAPVFMVDELDKVDLSERITGMVKRLKKLVAEEAFFCFLTDRKYFEELSGRTADAPYSIEYTYYSHQLFIVYSHQDLHYYLSQVLQTTRQPDAPAAVPNPLGTGSGGIPPSPQVVVDDDVIDTQILPYLILHGSQMHTIDLRRQLRAIRNDSGEVVYKPGETRGQPRFRYALMVQLAVETALEHPDMRSELEQRPAFLQVARDALYYISRRWQHAPANLNLEGESGRAEFERYLRSRMATDANLVQANGREEKDAAPKPGVGGFTYQQAGADSSAEDEHTPDNGGSTLTIDPATLDFLFGAVQALAVSLADVDMVRKAATVREVPQVVLDNLPKEPLLHSVKANLYRWQCFPSGREVSKGVPVPQEIPSAGEAARVWQDHVDVIEEFELSLADLSDVKPADLSNQFGILPTTPAWAEVRRACERLRSSERTNAAYTDMEIDISVVKEFHGILQESAPALEMALLCAKVLRVGSSWTTDGGPLSMIAAALRLRTINVSAVETKVRNLFTELLAHAPTQDALPQLPMFRGRESVSSWLKGIGSSALTIGLNFSPTGTEIALFKADAWSYWQKRLQSSTIAVRDPGFAVIYCAIHSIGPGLYLYPDPDQMGIGYWSAAFLAAFHPPSAPDPNPAAPWLAPLALRKLGLGAVVSRSPWLVTTLGLNSTDFPADSTVRDGEIGIVFSSGGTHAWNWLPQQEYPLLYVDFLRIPDFIQIAPSLKAALGVLNVALDGSDMDDPYAAPADPKSGPPTTPLGADAVLPITMLGRNVTDVFPVIVNDPPAHKNWYPNFRPITAQSPQELFRAFGVLADTAANVPR
ncbi:MAG TPA: hypothetical protein VGN16_16225 [Acidobacteriaceae bacterium]|jgi:hypothetical protein